MSNYRNGGDLERAAKKHLEAEGYFVMKSGGSKGPVDLLAMKPGETLFIQCKTRGAMPPAERMALRMLAIRLGAVPLLCSWLKQGTAARVPWFVRLQLGGTEVWTADRAGEAAARATALIDGGL